MPALTSQTINNGTSGTAAYTSYDSQGRIAYTLAPSQGGTGLGAQTTYTYGYTPGAWTITAATPNSAGGSHWTATTLDGAPAGTTYSYDALGRTTNVLLADGASHTQYRYQGNFTTIIDPANNWKQYASDSFGNLVSVIEPDPQYNPAPPSSPPAYPVTSAPAQTLLTSYTYDQLGHLTQVSMPRSNGTQTRTFTYTLKSYATVVLPVLQLTAASNPENGTVSYTYNADGTVANKKDANGNTLTYTYDAYGRLLTSPAGSFTYDTCPNNDTFCTNTPGQMVEAVFSSGIGSNQLSFQYDYTYTPAGKVTGKTLTLQSANHISTGGVKASGSLAASYTYDNQGALTSMMYPTTQTWAGSPTQTLNYTLDAMERPTGLADSWSDNRTPTTYASGVGYTPANQTNFGGRTYNNLLQLTQVGSITYSYSTTQNNGQITASVDATTGETITYQYDALKRLATAAGSNWGEQYTYDGFGNLTQMQPSGTAGAPSLSVNVDPATNRLSTTGVSYDNNGNMWASGSMYLTYDTLNRVTQVQTSPSNSHYGYDPDNLRVYYQDASGNETIYFYGADGQKQATYTYAMITNNGVPEIQLAQQSENVYFTGMMVRAEGSQVTLDRLGSAAWTHGSTHRYYPYGVEYHASGNDTEKYATYTRDGLTGLDYAVNRYYSSQWGRFLSPDPYGGSVDAGTSQSWNRYTYAANDPAHHVDPTGLDSSAQDCIANPTACEEEDGDSVFGSLAAGPDGLPCGFGYGTLCAINAVFQDTGACEYASGYGFAPVPGPSREPPAPCPPPPAPESQACTDWGCMPPAYARAIEALTLDLDCFDLYGNAKTRQGEWNPVTVLTSLFLVNDGTYGTVDFGYTGNGAALTKPTGLLLPSFKNGITGSSASISINAGYWNVDNVNYNAETLLHEMGHLYNFVRGAGGFATSNPSELKNSESFDALIRRDCGL